MTIELFVIECIMKSLIGPFACGLVIALSMVAANCFGIAGYTFGFGLFCFGVGTASFIIGFIDGKRSR